MSETLTISTEEEFNQLMESVDAELQAENVGIVARAITGWGKISNRYGLQLIMPAPKREPIEGCYSGYDLTIRIFRWFDKRYGSKQNFDPTWRIAFVLRGDVYKMTLPLIYGSVNIICSKDEYSTSKKYSEVTGRERPTINILNLIDDFTEGYAKSLTEDELTFIINTFQIGMSAMSNISDVSEEALVPEATGDIHASVTNLFVNPPQYGLSKWAALQATEKMLKAFITIKGQAFNRTHVLDDLAVDAELLGLMPIPRQQLALIQCSPGVRYGTPTVNLDEAIEAHQASLALCAEIARQAYLHKHYKQSVDLEIGKYYTNSMGKEYRCIDLNGDKATMVVFDQAYGKPLAVQFVQDRKFWNQYFEIADAVIIQQLDNRYKNILDLQKNRHKPN